MITVTRDSGFFMNHEQALQQCLDAGELDLGIAKVASLEQALGILWAQAPTFRDGTARSPEARAALRVAQQLLTARCNERLFGGEQLAVALGDDVTHALASGACADWTAAADRLARLNDEGSQAPLPAGFSPGTPTPLHARSTGTDPSLKWNLSCAN